jgi:hypothetical protein
VGDYCVLKPPLLKNDAFGLHFGWKPIWLPVGNSTTNAARAIAELIMATPIPMERASITPLFCLDCDGTPLYHREADRILAHLLKVTFPEEDSSRWSFHSLRIGAACALLKANASMELIQALCRWRSPKKRWHLCALGPRRLRPLDSSGAATTNGRSDSAESAQDRLRRYCRAPQRGRRLAR